VPSIVKVFPVPVCPYAKMHTFYPSKTKVANGTVSSKISAIKKNNKKIVKISSYLQFRTEVKKTLWH
jgi:hypothetical protein